MPSRQINDFLPKGNRKKLSEWPDLKDGVDGEGGDAAGGVQAERGQVLVVEYPADVLAKAGDLHHLGPAHLELGGHRVEPGHVLAHLGPNLLGFAAQNRSGH